jgi:hypothetical protein
MPRAPRVDPFLPWQSDNIVTDDTPTPVNEITAAAQDAKRCAAAAAGTHEPGKRRFWPLATIGLGIGSAALAAATLYSTRERSRKKR